METLPPISKYRVRRKYYVYDFAFIVTITLCFIFYYQQRKRIYFSELLANESNKVAEETSFLVSNLERVIHDVHFLSQMDNVNNLLQGRIDECSGLVRIYESYMRNYYGVEQVRLLDVQGNEIFRLNNTAAGGYVVPENELQNKRDRYYFKETIRLTSRDAYISNIDLNIEKGIVERPYLPVIRVSVPIFDSNEEVLGVLAVNYSASVFLRQLKNQKLYFFNGTQNLVAGLKENGEWGFYISDDKLGKEVRDFSDFLYTNASGYSKEDDNITAYRIIDPEAFHHDETSERIVMKSAWIVASVLRDYSLRHPFVDLRRILIVSYLILLFATVVITEILARISFKNDSTKLALELSDKKFKAIAQSSPGIIFQWFETYDGKQNGFSYFSYISKRIEGVLGIKPHDLIENFNLLRIYNEDRKVLLEKLIHSRKSLNDLRCEVRLYDLDSVLRWYRIVACVQETTDRYLFNGVMVDITEEKDIEAERLRNQKETEDQTVGWWFRLSGASLTGDIFSLIGYNVNVEGTQSEIDGFPISVEAACGGLQLLQVLMSGGIALHLIFYPKSKLFWIMLLILPLLAWISNTIRIVVILAWGVAFGAEAAAGIFHTWGAMLVLLIMLLLYLLIAKIINQIALKFIK
jgi:exosortase/archaeosortase family protein